jgi:hypothetical protein
LLKHYGSLAAINSSQNLNFTASNSLYLLQVRPFKNSKGLNWLIVAVVPETDFTQKVQANTRNTILLVLAGFGSFYLPFAVHFPKNRTAAAAVNFGNRGDSWWRLRLNSFR